jgi:DNA repair exonuclease SbcCD ATPase subunit
LNINLLRHENGFRYGLSEPRYDDYVSISEDDRDELIKGLLAESFGLRTKAEHLSQYVESRVAELVKLKKVLHKHESGEELQALQSEISQLRSALEELNALRSRSDRDLREMVESFDQLNSAHLELTAQRNRLRNRVAEIESTRTFRIAQRLDRIIRAISRNNKS